jgi:hypothetical protein
MPNLAQGSPELILIAHSLRARQGRARHGPVLAKPRASTTLSRANSAAFATDSCYAAGGIVATAARQRLGDELGGRAPALGGADLPIGSLVVVSHAAGFVFITSGASRLA